MQSLRKGLFESFPPDFCGSTSRIGWPISGIINSAVQTFPSRWPSFKLKLDRQMLILFRRICRFSEMLVLRIAELSWASIPQWLYPSSSSYIVDTQVKHTICKSWGTTPIDWSSFIFLDGATIWLHKYIQKMYKNKPTLTLVLVQYAGQEFAFAPLGLTINCE